MMDGKDFKLYMVRKLQTELRTLFYTLSENRQALAARSTGFNTTQDLEKLLNAEPKLSHWDALCAVASCFELNVTITILGVTL
jgi:hypothetical protein